jgi:hypothetical protein
MAVVSGHFPFPLNILSQARNIKGVSEKTIGGFPSPPLVRTAKASEKW